MLAMIAVFSAVVMLLRNALIQQKLANLLIFAGKKPTKTGKPTNFCR